MDNAKRMRADPTEAEQRLWAGLRNQQLGFKFRRQHRIGGYIVDFACVERKLVVEADGSQHRQQAEYDHERAHVLRAAGYRVLRFWNHDILKDTGHVLDAIWHALNSDSTQSTHGLTLRGKGIRSRPPSPQPSPPQAGERGKPGWQPSASFDAIRLRARLNALVRGFFAERGVLEVETPVLSRGGNSEPNIASFSLEFSGRTDGAPRTRWLRTSPEYPLKRLLAAGIGDCYELGRVFRDGEAGGRHNPEFTMLEWYRVGWDHLRLAGETAELVNAALALAGNERSATLRVAAYRDLYRDAIGIDPFTASENELRNALGDVHIDPAGLTRDDWLDLLMTHRLQPGFRGDELLAVVDWPASQCALARLRDDTDDLAVAERFELYLGAVELANGYHELADAGEQRARFRRDLDRRRQRGSILPPLDEAFLAALEAGLPDCAGVALGVDRLLMAMLGTDRIADVLAFDFADS